jgi:hypothetical protein
MVDIDLNKKYLIEPKCAPFKVIDVFGAKTENGTNIQIYNLGEGLHQYFKLVYAEPSYYYIEPCHCNNKRIDVRYSEVKNGANIHLWEKHPPEKTVDLRAQKFKLVPSKNNANYYYICSYLNDNFCIDVQNSGKSDGTNVWLYEKNYSEAQEFRFIDSLSAAIYYAEKYSEEGNRNPRYKSYSSNCMNFCSQCVYAGGVREDKVWYNGSVSFINIRKFKEHFSQKRGAKFIKNPDLNDIQPGDVIFIHSNGDDYGHAMFVTWKQKDYILVCANTTDRKNMIMFPQECTGVVKTSSLIN